MTIPTPPADMALLPAPATQLVILVILFGLLLAFSDDSPPPSPPSRVPDRSRAERLPPPPRIDLARLSR